VTAYAIAQAAYLVAALLFILSLAGLSKHETSRRGVSFGIAGMTIAIAATVWLVIVASAGSAPSGEFTAIVILVVAVLVGGSIGLWRARVVEMTGMPELIALLHSFVGAAAVLVGWNGALYDGGLTGALRDIHHAEVFIGVFIGGVTLTGSIVAFLKLSGRISSQPLVLPGKNVLNLGALVVFAGLTVWYVISPELWLLIAVTVLGFITVRSRYGRLLVATRDQEDRVRFLGYDPAVVKTIAFAIGAAMAGIAGALAAPIIGIVAPNQFTIIPSILMVCWVAVGGRGTLWGALLGALLVSWGRTSFSENWPNQWQYVQGGLFIVVIAFMPGGIAGLIKLGKGAFARKSRTYAPPPDLTEGTEAVV
jgi:NAD/NADP transhydrogenase beta subunit